MRSLGARVTPQKRPLVPEALPERSLLVQYHNCRLATPKGLVKGELWTQRGRIVDPQTLFWQRQAETATVADRRIDCGGLILAPGLIDVHVYGSCGVDFTSLGQEEDGDAAGAVQAVCEALPRLGVTAFCPTVRPCALDAYPRLLERLRPRGSRRESGQVQTALLGAHLDGPFLSAANVERSHDPAHLVHDLTDEAALERTCALHASSAGPPPPALVTLAPELPGALAAVRKLAEAGVVVGIGRTSADLRSCQLAVREGARLVTHLLVAMPAFHHRDPGPMGLLASCHASADADGAARSASGAEASPDAPADGTAAGAVSYSMTLDGAHQHPTMVSLALATSPSGFVAVSAAEVSPRAARGQSPPIEPAARA